MPTPLHCCRCLLVESGWHGGWSRSLLNIYTRCTSKISKLDLGVSTEWRGLNCNNRIAQRCYPLLLIGWGGVGAAGWSVVMIEVRELMYIVCRSPLLDWSITWTLQLPFLAKELLIKPVVGRKNEFEPDRFSVGRSPKSKILQWDRCVSGQHRDTMIFSTASPLVVRVG